MRQRVLAVVVFCFVLGLLLPQSGRAQSDEQMKAVNQALPAPAQQILARLGNLDRLEHGEWRVHPGDLAHGESPTLDDSSWPVATPRSEYGKDAVWFRRWIEVPTKLNGYDLSGADVWFRFRARTTDRGDLTEIVYFDGRRVALGPDLEKLNLFHNAKPGDRVLVAVKLLATAGDKSFYGSQETIDFSPNRPNPQDLHDEIVAAGLLIPKVLQCN